MVRRVLWLTSEEAVRAVLKSLVWPVPVPSCDVDGSATRRQSHSASTSEGEGEGVEGVEGRREVEVEVERKEGEEAVGAAEESAAPPEAVHLAVQLHSADRASPVHVQQPAV